MPCQILLDFVAKFCSLYCLFIFLLILNRCASIDHPAQITEFFDKTVPDEETLLTDEDFRRAKQAARRRRQADYLQPATRIDDSAMYNKSRFEGDIVNPDLLAKNLKNFISEDAEVAAQAEKMPGIQRNAVRQANLKWPNGRIPYTISKQYTSYGRDKIADAIADYQKRTCIQFVPKTTTDTDYVHILPDDGCYSLVGKVGGRQPVSLGDGCIQKGIIIHELMHSVGFFHEQSRADRDQYVTIKWTNVESGLEDQFDKYSLNMIDHLGTQYDYGSVMHYGPTAFSKNGLHTIDPNQAGVEIGQRVGFSATDLFKINKLYSCPNADVNPAPSVPSSLIPSPQTVPSSPNTVVTTPNTCFDMRPDCQYLAGRGHCDSIFSAAFMAANCARSCNRCVGSSTTIITNNCEDSRTWCPRWASSGMCELYMFQSYMHQKCAVSCGLCVP
ncbi:astacin (Peptidase family m12A) domain-containing protein [Ditylenchus destructor]|uniref:Metalloendopeptidase n=1 Tax=Ditylenchus destructor TaxID=166010 RepID=A0AAD4R0Z3_9BILA|nr:astacin (Peptidase family m12A) domain-containing protein [Ditylenchus destructor]